MNIRILLLAVATFTFASCSSTYKNTQTPDDVYYSPARSIEKDVRQEQVKRFDPEEREIRMSAYDSRWRTLNNRYNYGYNLSPYDYDYGYNNYNPYSNSSYYSSYGKYGGYYGYNNNYYGNSGYYYNPYYASYPIYIVTTTTPVNRTPRKVNLSGYGQNNNTRPISSINTNNSRNNNSNTTNRTYNNSNSTRNKTYTVPRNETQNRTYNPSTNNSTNNNSGRSSSGSSNSSGSSSSGSVERPTRGNN